VYEREFRCCVLLEWRGRYKAAGTARVSEISKMSLPDLRLGKTPSPQVWAHLTLGNYKELDGNDKRKKAIEAWQKRGWPDAKAESRKQKTPSANVPFWSTAATTKQDMEHRGGAKLGRPPSYRLDFGLYKGLTVPQVTRAGRKGTVASGAAYILYPGNFQLRCTDNGY